MTDFRPISFCNVVYKIVSKALANRLCVVLGEVISETQSAFVPVRLISDNAIIGLECLHALRTKRRKKGSLALKLDMSKAYDHDSLLFSGASLRECVLIRRILDVYSRASGLLKIHGWSSKVLSVGGKEVLIKAVLQAIPAYAMSLFRLPKGLIADIQMLCCKFWWGSTDAIKKIHWGSWDRLCVRKEDGGINFRNFHVFNQALLAKQGWRLEQNPHSLAAKVVKSCYYPISSFMKADKGKYGYGILSHEWNGSVILILSLVVLKPKQMGGSL
ncbi:hypothetical protein Dsin_025515 [Dipteronia sinensis]|uniref:Reverse transcriptase domain-containing protein n=1 Tax=Dipteronia sinensis TaxID=43782 RepID=A0AAE0DWW2_9ROSI|nr:hypothetical protein Dsin_025515 [Dipteronia sinensis]